MLVCFRMATDMWQTLLRHFRWNHVDVGPPALSRVFVTDRASLAFDALMDGSYLLVIHYVWRSDQYVPDALPPEAAARRSKHYRTFRASDRRMNGMATLRMVRLLERLGRMMDAQEEISPHGTVPEVSSPQFATADADRKSVSP